MLLAIVPDIDPEEALGVDPEITLDIGPEALAAIGAQTTTVAGQGTAPTRAVPRKADQLRIGIQTIVRVPIPLIEGVILAVVLAVHKVAAIEEVVIEVTLVIETDRVVQTDLHQAIQARATSRPHDRLTAETTHGYMANVNS